MDRPEFFGAFVISVRPYLSEAGTFRHVTLNRYARLIYE